MAMGSLEKPLHQTLLDPQTRKLIVSELWPPPAALPEDSLEELNWDAYFMYYTKQCSHALHNRGRHVLSRSHQDIIDICGLLRHSTKDEIKQRLRAGISSGKMENEDDVLENSINLAARLVSMMDVGVFQYMYSGRPELVWSAGTLSQFLTKHFSQPQVLGDTNIKLEKCFTAFNLNRIAGIKIEWTDNLADHLRMVEGDQKVAVFQHASFLKWQRR